MLWQSSISTKRAFGLDLEGAARGLEEHLAGEDPDLVLVFLSHHHSSQLEAAATFLLRRFEHAVLVGLTGSGVVGRGQEVEAEPAVAMLGAVLPDVEIRPFCVTPAEVQYLSTHPEKWRERVGVPPGVVPTFLVFPEPFTCDGEKLVASLDAAWPSAIKLGGLASGARHPGENKLLLDRAVHDRGAVGVAMWGDVEVEALVAQGARPLGTSSRVTAVRGNLIVGLDRRPALETLEALVARLPEADRDIFVAAPVLGLRPANARPGYVIRNVIGIDRRRAAVGVAMAPSVGDEVQFHLRSPAAAREELDGLLARARPAAGGLLVTCIARGQGFFGMRHHDISRIRGRFPALEVGGLFANGELGPVGGKTWMHGYTSVLGLFRPKQG